MDPLAEMHLLLREHGWEPEVLLSRWNWSRPGWNFVFWTLRCLRNRSIRMLSGRRSVRSVEVDVSGAVPTWPRWRRD
jgi:hypothetical protein